MNPSKTRLTAYEVMMLLGNFNPKLSEQVKAALDEQLKKLAGQDLPQQRAFGLACRTLAREHPEAFDPTNRDDSAMKRLAPLLFDEEGNPVEFSVLREQIEIHNATLTFRERGEDGLIHVTARDETGPTLQTCIAVKMKKK